MTNKFPDKITTEVLDYRIDWSTRLSEGEVIMTSTWVVPGDLVKDSDMNDTDSVTVWLSGGEARVDHELVNTITTSQGRTMVEKVMMKVLGL